VYMITGSENQANSSSGMDIVIYKFNPTGAILWKKAFDYGAFDFPTKCTLVAGKLTLIGYSDLSGFDWMTIQLNTEGTQLWNAQYNGSVGVSEYPHYLAANADGEVFVTGKGGPTPTLANVADLRMITLKYNNAGVQQWVDSTNIYSGWGYACTLASDGSLFALSGTSMTVFHFLNHTVNGSCNIPLEPAVTNVADHLATISWTPTSGATLYHIRYKPVTSGSWTTVSYNFPSINIFDLQAGTTYEYGVEAVCESGPSGYTATQNFTTTGTAMCASSGLSQQQEYISQVWIQGGMINNSGSNNGYGDFTSLVSKFIRNQQVRGFLSGLVPYPEYEYYGIWIDYNHDNDFTDAGEDVATLYSDLSGFNAFEFTIPENAPLGPTRMRIIMSHDIPPTPCGNYARGETEDYAVYISDTSTAPPAIPLGLSVSNITQASATFNWTPDQTAASYQLRYKRTTENTWTLVPVNVTSITIPGLSAATDYNFSCAALGTAGISGYGPIQNFRTLGTVLPVNELVISAQRNKGIVTVNWTTRSEIGTAYFELERSTNGFDFVHVARINASGNSSTVSTYNFVDRPAEKNWLFYRLKIVDRNGTFLMSQVIKVNASQDQGFPFVLYPNPASENVSILLNEVLTVPGSLKIINQTGQIIQQLPIGQNSQKVNVNISRMARGLYFVTLNINGAIISKKLIIH
jgi:GEVED domain/Secretion system C-terminal sorting domain/Fibronectin type III domain